jgi:hypothetical protein
LLEGSKDTATELKLPRDISVSILNSRCLIFFNADIWKRLPKMNITIKPKKYEIVELSVLKPREIPAERSREINGIRKVFL